MSELSLVELSYPDETSRRRRPAGTAANGKPSSKRSPTRDLAKELIDFLGLIGGDPDLENELLDDDSEELEDDDSAEDDGTAEPSLGWTDDETIFGKYARHDFEGPDAA